MSEHWLDGLPVLYRVQVNAAIRTIEERADNELLDHELRKTPDALPQRNVLLKFLAALNDGATPDGAASAAHALRQAATLEGGVDIGSAVVDDALDDILSALQDASRDAYELRAAPTHTPPVIVLPTVFVYCIRDDDRERVKIGRSRDPDRRLRQLQTGSSTPLRMVCEFEAGRNAEKTLHYLFYQRRLRVNDRVTEWLDDKDLAVSTKFQETADGWVPGTILRLVRAAA